MWFNICGGLTIKPGKGLNRCSQMIKQLREDLPHFHGEGLLRFISEEKKDANPEVPLSSTNQTTALW